MAEFGGDDEDMDGMSFHDRLDFWGLEVPPNKQVDVVFGEDDEELIHLTQVALGDKPGDEPAAVSLVVKGKTTFIGTLRKAKCDQFSLDLALGETFAVKHTGKSTVYLTGWRQVLASVSDEDEESDEEDEDEGEADEDEDEDEDEEEEAPRVAPQMQKKLAPAKPAAGADRVQPGVARGAAPVKPAPAKPAPAAAKKAPAYAASDSDSDDDDDEPSPPASMGKHPADRQLMSPAPKKTPMAAPPSAGKTPSALKTPLGSKTPATPAAEQGVSTPGNVDEFEAQIVAFLKTHGRTGMSALGGKVKKPGNVSKLNTFVKDRPHLFKLVGDQVELKKK